MSSAPSPVSTLKASVALVWRTLRSMRTALILLLLLALASVAGSLIPQYPNTPDRVLQYIRDHPFWGDVFVRAQLFDVFGSWWFTLITVLLFVSLVACLVPRSRALVRALRQRPVQARELDAFPHYTELAFGAEPKVAIERAARLLKRRRFRIAVDPERPALAAEKGWLRDAGSLVFHWAFVLLLIGVVVGKGTGYTGRATIVEGQTWTDAEANYDGDIREGRFFRGDFSGIGIHLRSFDDAYRDTGVPMDFVSDVDLISPDGATTERAQIRVNHPARFDGLRIFQYGFGWAPVVELAAGGETLRETPVVMAAGTPPEGVSQLAAPWTGFIKLTTVHPQLAVQFELWPDSRAFFRQLLTGEATPMVTAFQPFITYVVWRGHLSDPSQTALDTSGLRQVATGALGAGWTVDLVRGCLVSGADLAQVPNGLLRTCPEGEHHGLTMSFPKLLRYTRLQVSRDVGVPVVLGAAILVMLGLLASLYTSRRKLWIRADPAGTGSTLRVGGFALQRKDRFVEEFERVVSDLRGSAPVDARSEEQTEKVSP